jgi:predicted nuclease of restriction endonuclease-like RecB superfamily
MMHRRLQALGRLKPGERNRTEAAFERWLLQRKQIGEILWYAFEGIKLRLADNTFYTPDFAVMEASRELVLYEVKGFWTDDARVKTKVAASLFPLRFVAVKAKAKRDGGGWEFEEF